MNKILDVTPEQYHRDPCDTPSLSTSIAKLLIDRSPKHAWAAHPKLGAFTVEPSEAMDHGTLIHRFLLGKGSKFVEIEADSYRTKEAQRLRDEARASGKVPVLSELLASIKSAANEISGNLLDYGIDLTQGDNEVAVTWQERVFMSDAVVQCRAMFDSVFWNEGTIYDVKKISSAHPESCARAMTNYGYDIQRASYTSALRNIRPELAGREDFVFLFVEIEPPYCVTPLRPDGQFRALGDARWDRAVRLWHECLTENNWPAYVSKIEDVSPPAWALAREPSVA